MIYHVIQAMHLLDLIKMGLREQSGSSFVSRPTTPTSVVYSIGNEKG